MAHYVLIHGAWHGGWCWHKVNSILRAAGHKVENPSLPAHSNGSLRRIIPWAVNLTTYINRMSKIVESADEPVVLVGHSMSGMVITALGEKYPDRIKKLVYLCAFVPPSGKSLADLAPDVSPIQPEDQKVHFLRGGVGIKKEKIKDIFYNETPLDDIAFAKAKLCLEPLRALRQPVHWSEENLGRVPKMAIICERDRAIRPDGQRKMAENLAIKEIVSLDNDHSPFFSNPLALTEILLKI